MRKVLSYMLILISVTLILLPTIQDAYNGYLSNKLTSEAIEKNNYDEKFNESTNNYSSVYYEYKELRDCYNEDLHDKNVLLIIDKIDFKQIVLEGASEDNLKISVASIYGKGKPGEGNYCIAGHRSKYFGKNFNRILEIKKSDKIKVLSDNKIYEYKVCDVFKVKPEEIWVLNQSDKAEITLISCYPMYNPQWRIIVKGSLTE